MQRKRALIIGGLAAVLVASAVYAAEGGGQDEADVAALSQAKVSLGQAVAAAERHANGRAARAELENENGKLVYGVEVVGPGKTTDVKVDINSGQVLSAQADQADQAGGEHEHEGSE